MLIGVMKLLLPIQFILILLLSIDGATCAQIFVGQETLVANVYGMKSDKQFIDMLEDNVHKRGAMDKLISDSAQVEISNKVKDFL